MKTIAKKVINLSKQLNGEQIMTAFQASVKEKDETFLCEARFKTTQKFIVGIWSNFPEKQLRIEELISKDELYQQVTIVNTDYEGENVSDPNGGFNTQVSSSYTNQAVIDQVNLFCERFEEQLQRY